MTNLFEVAVRNKYRFTSPPGINPQGQLAVEQVLSLSIEALDAMAVMLGEQLETKAKTYRSNKRTLAQQEVQNKLDLVVFILQEKEEILSARKEAQVLKEQEDKLDALLAAKQEQAQASLSIEELQKLKDEARIKRLSLGV